MKSREITATLRSECGSTNVTLVFHSRKELHKWHKENWKDKIVNRKTGKTIYFFSESLSYCLK